MTQAYNALSNDGTYSNISTINHIDIDSKTFVKDRNEHQVISSDAANMLKISLNAVARYGTGKGANLNNTTTYLKTGTTNEKKDVWTCGFTDDATLCLWAGYDIPKSLPFYNVNDIWKQIMQTFYST